MKLQAIEVVEDVTQKSRCDEGFLRVARLRLRNRYEDGTSSAVYPCDVVSRPGSDAVVAVLYHVDAEGRVSVVLRESPRAPIYLRRFKALEHPDPREYRALAEVVAGIIEPGDGADTAGLRKRAAIEAREEAGYRAEPASFTEIGGGSFASPGTSDEKVYYCAGAVRPGEREEAAGDGSVMEECARLLELELGAAIEACRSGEIPDMKTEIALLRLADHLGWLPQLGCFADELPAELRARYRRLGVAPSEAAEATLADGSLRAPGRLQR
jgi:ADP-ribose pyrophosphatase